MASDEKFGNLIIDQTLKEASLQVGPLESNKTYYWKVQAIKGDKKSDWSEISSFTIVEANPILSVNPDVVYLNNQSGSFKIVVKNVGTGTLNWSSSTANNWLHIIKRINGINTDTISVDYDANNGQSRVGKIIISASGSQGSPQVNNINQEGKKYQPPLLKWVNTAGFETDGLDPEEGSQSSSFIFKVEYVDSSNYAPAPEYPKLHLLKSGDEIKGSPFVMVRLGDNIQLKNGIIYGYEITNLDSGEDYSYYFEAKDSIGSLATGDPTNIKNGPIVKPLPRAAFKCDTIGVVQQPVLFKDRSTGNPTSWLWDFGDGNTSSSQNPNHSYKSAGSYTISLTVSNQYGSNTTIKTVFINKESLTITPDSISLTGLVGNQQSFNITSNISWQIISGVQGWFSASPDSGSNNGTVVITAQMPWPGSDRSATLTIGNSDGSTKDSVVVKQSSLSGIDNIKLEKSIRIYPNPAKTALYIGFKDISLNDISISVYDSYGKLLFKKYYDKTPLTVIRLSLLNYNNGVYYVRIKTNKGIVTRKFVVSIQ